MKELKTGNIVDFLSIDEFTGKEVKLTGKILGDYLAVRKQFPIECAEIMCRNTTGFFLGRGEGSFRIFCCWC